MNFIWLVIFSFFSLSANAKIIEETVEYMDGNTPLEGYIAYDTSKTGKRPGILIVHEWTGAGDFVRSRAKELARLGYVAFAADIYGKGVRPNAGKEAAEISNKYKQDRALFRQRLQLGLKELKKSARVDANKTAAIGYCFGGTGVLELARSGADLLGVVSFHGGLDAQNLDDAKKIKAKVLVLHGADDPHVPEKQVAEFELEMKSAKVDWQLTKYANAVHSFTNPQAGSDPSKGAAYNPQADKRSWLAMKDFFVEIFRK